MHLYCSTRYKHRQVWWGLDADARLVTVRTHKHELALVCVVFCEHDNDHV